MSGNRKILRLPSPAMGVALLSLAVAFGGVAIAAIPDNGVVHGCYDPSAPGLAKPLYVRDNRAGCGNSSTSGQPLTALDWNQAGMPGPQGPAGTLSSVKIVNAVTSKKATFDKDKTVFCPPGSFATGGGYRVVGDVDGRVTLRSIPVERSVLGQKSGTADGWRVTLEKRPHGSVSDLRKWKMRVFAACAQK